MQHIKDNILQAADKVFETEKWTDCFILDIILNDKKVEIYADTDEGIKFWQCQKLSRGIEAYLDESQVLGEKYTLEVSSPGVDKPLQLYRQYPRNIGRQLKVSLTDDSIMEGTLLTVNEEKLELKVKGAKRGCLRQRKSCSQTSNQPKCWCLLKRTKRKNKLMVQGDHSIFHINEIL